MTVHPPKVSVAIPVYNGETYLAAAIESVLAQSLADFELVICDDHSTDRSFEIAAAFTDRRIRLLRNPANLGFGGNWNRCLAEAQGQYIKILPQDDLLHRDCLQMQAAVLDQDKEGGVALVFCARTIIGPGGQVHMRRGYGARESRLSGIAIARRTARSGTNPVGEPGAVMFRQSAARAAGRFSGERPFVIDIDYWLRLLKFGSAVYLPEALASFRVSAASQSVKMARRQAADFTAFLAQLRQSGLYPLSAADVRRGRVTAVLNGLGRAAFYRLAMRKGS
jgi:glycosyltransferase involved in cell wall biosynthesis